MKKPITSILRLVLVGLATLGVAAANAHHSAVANYIPDETIVIEGVVTEFWFANPHARIYLDVTTDAGETEDWMAEGGSRNNLIRDGWSKDKIRPGMALIIEGNPSRNGSPTLHWKTITTESGEILDE